MGISLRAFIKIASKYLQRSKKFKKKELCFQDFLPCEQIAQTLGYTFLPKFKNFPTKLARRNGILVQVMQVVILILLSASFVLSVKADQLYIMFENVLFVGVNTVMIVKIYMTFYQNLSKIHDIIEKLNKNFPHCEIAKKVSRFHKNLKTLNKFKKLFFLAYNSIVLQFCLMPFLHQMYGQYKSIDVQWEQIFALNLPIEQFKISVYPFIYIIEAWIAYFAMQYVICTDMLFACIMEILVMEFKTLGQKFSEIKLDVPEKKAIQELKKLVNVHQELIEISDEIDEVFSPILLINAFGSITGLCTACFLSVVI